MKQLGKATKNEEFKGKLHYLCPFPDPSLHQIRLYLAINSGPQDEKKLITSVESVFFFCFFLAQTGRTYFTNLLRAVAVRSALF